MACPCRAARWRSRPRKPATSRVGSGGRSLSWKSRSPRGADGRGAKSPAEAERIAADMIGMTLVTHQTGAEGRVVGRVLIEEGLRMTRELYLSLLLDRAAGKLVMMASAAGGMDIEEVAAKTPEQSVDDPTTPRI